VSVLDAFRLDGKVAIVTGAGRGIGASIARTFAEAGADVVLTARTKEQLDEVAADVRASGHEALVIPADVNDNDVLEEIVADLGGRVVELEAVRRDPSRDAGAIERCARGCAQVNRAVRHAKRCAAEDRPSFALLLPPRLNRARVRARPVQTPGGRSSDPTSGRSLLQVAPCGGAGGTRRAAPAGRRPLVRSELVPRLTTRTRSLPPLSRRPAPGGTTARSSTTKKAKQVATVAAAENSRVNWGLGVVILGSSLLRCRVSPMPRPAGHPSS